MVEGQRIVLNCSDIDTHLEHDIKFYEYTSDIPIETQNSTDDEMIVENESLIFPNLSK